MKWPKTGRQLEREVVEHQNRERLRARIQRLLDKWQPILGVKVHEFHIKKMVPWGTTNEPERRMWISEALATMPLSQLEYVVVHELVHLVAEGHGHDEKFYALMDRYLPGWRRRHKHMRSSDGVVASALPPKAKP